jgi:hypothetical protein
LALHIYDDLQKILLVLNTISKIRYKVSIIIMHYFNFFFWLNFTYRLFLIFKIDKLFFQSNQNLTPDFYLIYAFFFKLSQLNDCETDPYFLQLSQNMAINCLFDFVFFPVLTWIYLFCAKNCFVLMFRTIFSAKQVNLGKCGEKHKSKQTIACHVLA